MFEDLYDAVSFLWSWRWPANDGRVTEVLVERIKHHRNPDTFRLSVTYEFSIGADGPYTGESFWAPAFCQKRRVIAARHKFRSHQPVVVRYRADDPSVNKLDQSLWKGL
jgi:hypothetical protein